MPLKEPQVNSSLPPVGIPIKVFIGSTWIPCIRGVWITKSDVTLPVILQDGSVTDINRTKIKWIYP